MVLADCPLFHLLHLLSMPLKTAAIAWQEGQDRHNFDVGDLVSSWPQSQQVALQIASCLLLLSEHRIKQKRGSGRK